jgi:TRAP transporter TAXI family solute receptor
MRWLKAWLAVLMIVLGGSAAAQPGVLGLGTMAAGTLSYGTGSVIAEMMTGELKLETRVQPHSGESTLLGLLAAGELDFAIANALEAAEAFTGEGAFAGQPQSELRIAAVLYPLRVGLFVRAESDIRTIADLEGKRVTAGFSSSSAIASLLEAALAGGGLTMDDVVAVPVTNVVAGAEQFADGRTDAFFFAIGAAKVSEIDATTPLRLLPLQADAAGEARVEAVVAEAYIDDFTPPPGMAALDGRTPVLSFDNLLVTTTATSSEVVRAVVDGLVSHRETLALSFPPFRGLEPEALTKPGLRTPFHAAALEAVAD